LTQEADLSSAIAALWERQRGEMISRVDTVEAGITALLNGTLTEDLRDETERAAHKIAGSAGTFGFADASRHARTIELALRNGEGEWRAAELSDLAEAVRRAFDEPAGAPEAPVLEPEPATPAEQRADLVIVCDDRVLGEQIQEEVVGRGLHVTFADDADSARHVRAEVAVTNLADPGAQGLVEHFARAGTAVIGLAADAGLDERVAFARWGGRMLLFTDTPPNEFADAVEALRERLSDQGKRVLVVDDDRGVLDLTTTILRGHGLEVSWLDDPKRFWQVLEARNPDVLLLDLEMPGFNGLELCQAVRADRRWSQLPILFLTGRTEPESIRAVYAAGADDYMAKPVVEEELIQRIHNRLERLQLLRDMADRDPLTGVANRRKAAEELRRLERLAKRYGQPLTVAILDIDHFKRVNDTYGHDTGDEVLRTLGNRLHREFRDEDVVGRWGGEEFVIGMYGMPGVVAVDRMSALLEDWKGERFDDSRGGKFGVSFTVGLAELPGDAPTVAEVQRRADEALYRGKAAGRSRVVIAGERSDHAAQQVDVAVVAHDDAVANLLTDALTREGWVVERLTSGPTAIGALASHPPLLHARVVLLDLDLPDVDGLGVLSRLRDRGVLHNTHVLAISGPGGGDDLAQALERGAIGHVTKPIAAAQVVDRVRELLA
jgi:diguanylate cyclase (GGDEF)-like protein